MSATDVVRLRHMLDAATAAVSFAAGRSRDDLETDQMFAFALVRAIQIVGEAGARLSPETRDMHSDISWRGIIGMRNKIVHDYFDIDYDVVWRTVTHRLPELIAQLKKIIPPDRD